MNGENVSGDQSQQLDVNIEEPIAKKSSEGLTFTAKFVDNKVNYWKKSIGKPKGSSLFKSCQGGLEKAGPAIWTGRNNKGIQKTPE